MSLHIRSSRSRGLSAGRIISRILSLAETPKPQSELLEEILVSRSTLSRYVGFLREQGLLEQVDNEGKARLKTTPKGRQYLRTRTLLPKNEASTRNDSANENHESSDSDNGVKSSNRKSESYLSPNWSITPNID